MLVLAALACWCALGNAPAQESDASVIYSGAPQPDAAVESSPAAPLFTPSPSLPAPTSSAAVSAPARTAPAPAAAAARWHRVQQGETLMQIAAHYRTTTQSIKSCNGMASGQVYPGQYLRLPPEAHAPAPARPMGSTGQPAATPSAAAAPGPPSAASASRPSGPTLLTERIRAAARELAERDLDYNQSWHPPGTQGMWAMDCSNTSRYLYWKATGFQLPRTASDQYYELKQKGLAWDVPRSGATPDMEYLRAHLKPGDLLFWEHTYKPQRDPPITHVMIFLGKNPEGEWLMAGSQTWGRGAYGKRPGGPNVYRFDPRKPCGGYHSWFGGKHTGRFVAIGRPLPRGISEKREALLASAARTQEQE